MKKLSPIIANTTYSLVFDYKDKNGIAIDITGATAKLSLRKTALDLVSIDAIGVVEGVEGKITFNILPEQTNGILERSKETYFIGAILTLASGEVISLLQSEIQIQENIVRD